MILMTSLREQKEVSLFVESQITTKNMIITMKIRYHWEGFLCGVPEACLKTMESLPAQFEGKLLMSFWFPFHFKQATRGHQLSTVQWPQWSRVKTSWGPCPGQKIWQEAELRHTQTRKNLCSCFVLLSRECRNDSWFLAWNGWKALRVYSPIPQCDI